MRSYVDQYKHLDNDPTSPLLKVEVDGITITLQTDVVVEGLLHGDYSVQRLASALYHKAMQEVEEEKLGDHLCKEKYVKEAEMKANACKELAETWIW